MNRSFNRQFILLDFRLLANREFLKFIGSSEYVTYLVLRRYVWRSEQPHYMGLHKLYLQDHLLASSIEREKIAEVSGVAPDNISRHLSSLASKGIIRRVRTGRQSIYVLGEWVDVHGDGNHREVEWFYLDGCFGLEKADLTPSVRSDLSPASDQNRLSASDNNREENKEENTVNGSGKKKSPVASLPVLKQDKEKTDYVAGEILESLGDQHSKRFYQLVAARVPESVVRKALAEIKQDSAEHPAKAFTYRMNEYALRKLKDSIG
jgi:DNA-binding transcriptional ArsR family regulator